MESKTTLRISLFGLTDVERQRIHAISTVTKNNPRTYRVLDSPNPAETDIAIVDGEDPRAVAAWRHFQTNAAMVPAILVAKDAKAQGDCQIQRPLMVTRLLRTLNDISTSREERPAFTDPQPATLESTPSKEKEEKETAQTGEKEEKETAQTRLVQRALVVDDSLLIRHQMALELRDLAEAVDFAENGERATELLMEYRYDVVFLDVMLPDIDGYQVCKNIRNAKHCADTKVIMLTSKSSPFDRIRGKLAGCDAYLVKPVDPLKFKQITEDLQS